MIGPNSPLNVTPAVLEEENNQLRRAKEELEEENRRLELQVKALKQQLWGRKSERLVFESGVGQGELFVEPTAVSVAKSAPVRVNGTVGSREPKGPKPLDPALPRETIKVADPELKALICPETKQPMRPGFVETLEVLARKPAVYFVKVYERTVWVSPAKTAPVYSPWPTDVLPRSRVHASVVAHIAAAHYCEHLPFYRIEKQLERSGVDLPRVCQVSLMQQLDQLVKPAVEAIKAEVLSSGYVHVDATPVPLCDPARPGAAREATLWAYRAESGAVWFDYQKSKSPQHPDGVLKAAQYRGVVQTDGAAGLDQIGVPGQVVALGCHAHLRRYFFKAWKAGEGKAEPYLLAINRLFRLERLAKHFALGPPKKETLRERHSRPLFEHLLARAQADALTTPPKTLLGEALHYLLAQKVPLARCLNTPGGQLSNNVVENSIRPLKLGVKNWLQIGAPSAGPRLAHLFTLVENCRQVGLDAEAYLIELIARLPDHPAKRIAELLPRQWARAKAP